MKKILFLLGLLLFGVKLTYAQCGNGGWRNNQNYYIQPYPQTYQNYYIQPQVQWVRKPQWVWVDNWRWNYHCGKWENYPYQREVWVWVQVPVYNNTCRRW
jgi:hypothetical protein